MTDIIKATGAKKCEIPYSHDVKLQWAVSPVLQKIQLSSLYRAWDFLVMVDQMV